MGDEATRHEHGTECTESSQGERRTRGSRVQMSHFRERREVRPGFCLTKLLVLQKEKGARRRRTPPDGEAVALTRAGGGAGPESLIV